MEFQKIPMNKYQTELTEELVNSLPQEVQDQLFDIINNVEFVKRLISPTREYAKDRPRDDRGRIIVDLANPHILEDMDYFRPSAIHYEKYGTFTNLRPNANPNSEYGKWVREERRRIWDGYVRESDGEWVTGYMYWFLNYSPMMLSKIREYKDKNGKKRKSKRADRVEALPECWEGIYWRFHCLDQASNGGLYNNFEGGQHMAELASRGKGKAHPYNEIVYTPKGKKLWGDIKIGDLLYDENGGTTKVIDIPFNDVAPIYEVKFSNGETVRCSEGHLWEVKSHDDHDKTFILSTKELLSKFRRPKKITPRAPKGYENNYTIINAIGVEMPKVNTNIDPYTFGLLLGDGCFRQSLAQNRAYFTSSDEDFETYSKLVPYNHKKGAGKYEYTFEIPKFGDYLKSVGLYMAKSEDKFIPDEYKYNSKEVRVNLLKGLLDSDGAVIGGRIELVLTSKRLIDDVKWILSSLGISYTKERVKHTFYYDRNRNKVPCKNAYRLSIFSNSELFNLNRKLALWRARSMSNYGQSKYRGIKIVDIRYIGEEKAKCVTVDSPTHKYLIGTFIPTHNSYSLASILNHIFVVGENEEAHEKVKGIVTAYQKEYLTKDGVLNKFVDMANFCATNTQFPRKRLKNSLQEMTWIMGYKDVELDIERGTQNTVLGVSSKDDESKLRGKRAAKILIEEFGCHIKGTKVLMYNGSIKNVEDIVVGDILMGDDNTPRVVQELYSGIDQLYKITLSNGDCQIVNSQHPVYFKKYNWNNGTYTEHTLTAPELLNIKNLDRGYYIPKAIIHFPYTPVSINPYFLGLWLGDGDSTRLDIANEDSEVLDWLSDNYEGTIRDLNQSETCKVFHINKPTHVYNRLFSEYNLYNNKYIPQDYKANASEVQLQVVAGLIDTDGTYNSKRNFFEITQRYNRKHILDDIKFMCECNGLKCSMSSRISTGKKEGILHYRLRISGDLSIIPTKIRRKRGTKVTSYKSRKCWNDYTFKVEPYKVDEYYGFTVDKNHLFVLGDLTITHNTFPRLVDLYNVLLPSVQEGDIVFGQIYMLGTAGDNESDFAGAQEIMYNPKGYNMYALPNVFDKYNQGKPYFVFFFPGYVNRKGCYNENGVSDVIKALIEILMNRYRVKYNSTDPNTIIKTIAEVPITPAEAIVKTGVNMFPVADLTERVGQLDSNPTEYDDVYVGDLVFSKEGQVKYKPTSAQPIRDFPHKDNKIEGAIEIYQLPEIDKNTGKPYNDRYILGADPYDDDESNTMSLGSIFVLDLWTDRIVAEYTGRPSFADDYYEICRKLCLFYNGRLNYEYNKKGLFSHFSTRNSLYLLTDVLDFLKEKQMMKDGYGNKSKGTNASPAINAYARSRLRSWLLAPVLIMQTIDGEEKGVMVPRLFTVRNRALLKELINYNSEGNFDRISAMGMLMLLREDRMIRYQGNISKEKQEIANNSYGGNDPFFKKNYDSRFKQ